MSVQHEGWVLPLSVFWDGSASYSPRPEFGYKKIMEMDATPVPLFDEVAEQIAKYSGVPERFKPQVMKAIKEHFETPLWREMLMVEKVDAGETYAFFPKFVEPDVVDPETLEGDPKTTPPVAKTTESESKVTK